MAAATVMGGSRRGAESLGVPVHDGSPRSAWRHRFAGSTGSPVNPIRSTPRAPNISTAAAATASRRTGPVWAGGAAAFDAYSTRRVLSGNYGTEGNPLLRPFAHSNALYVATQVSPAVMDLIGKRMMVSENRWIRRMWWLPQVAGSGFSIGAGVHNMGVAK